MYSIRHSVTAYNWSDCVKPFWGLNSLNTMDIHNRFCQYFHLTDEETEAQRGKNHLLKLTCPVSTEADFKPREVWTPDCPTASHSRARAAQNARPGVSARRIVGVW